MIYNTSKYEIGSKGNNSLNNSTSDFYNLSTMFKNYYGINQTNYINSAKIFPVDIKYYHDFCNNVNLQSMLGPKIISRLTNRKAFLVFNHSHEGYHPGNENVDYDLFKKYVLPQIINLDIPLSSIYFITGDLKTHRIYNKTIEDMNFIGLDIFGEFVGKVSGSRVGNDWFDNSLRFRLDKEKDFLYLNGCPRPGKCILKYALEKEHLLDNSIYSWLHRHEAPDAAFIDYLTSKFSVKYKNSADILKSANSIHELDASLKTIGELQDAFPKNFLERTIINLVPETSQFEPTFFITEKTYKCILFKQPFLIWGNPFILSYLRESGYVTFSNIFDETYDSIDIIPSIDTRRPMISSLDAKIDCIIQNLKNFKERAIGKEKEVNDMLDYNYNLFRNKNPSVEYNKTHLTQLLEAAERL